MSGDVGRRARKAGFLSGLLKKAMLLLMDFSIMSLVALGIAFCGALEYACVA
jgi:hypothetical protein